MAQLRRWLPHQLGNTRQQHHLAGFPETIQEQGLLPPISRLQLLCRLIPAMSL